jgi:hypothetical protein
VILSPVVIRPKTILETVFYAFAVAAALYLAAFGVAVLSGTATRPVQGFWKSGKFFYGALPVGVTLAILTVTSRWGGRLFARRRNAWLAACAVAILAVPLDAIVLLSFRGRQDGKIQVAWRKE